VASNSKALIALVLGAFAMANLVLTVLIVVFRADDVDGTALWLVPPFLALSAGGAAAFLGSLGWIDVRRGVTDRRLREAQLGAILGGIAAGAVVAAIAILIVVFFVLVVAMGGEAGAD
jgi:hypothetical protein